eukprot:scaffold48900_cov60-Phaeocystis_antarctica.AAC.1
MPTEAPAWLRQPRASQRGACTGPSSWLTRSTDGGSSFIFTPSLKLKGVRKGRETQPRKLQNAPCEVNRMMIVASTVYTGSLHNKTHRSDCVRFQSLLSNAYSSAVASTASEVSSRVWPGIMDIRYSRGFVSDVVDNSCRQWYSRLIGLTVQWCVAGWCWCVSTITVALTHPWTVEVDDMACVERSRTPIHPTVRRGPSFFSNKVKAQGVAEQ